jgi:hypothetical protein
MTFPNGLAPDAQNDTNVTLYQKMVQLIGLLCQSAGKSYVDPNPNDSTDESRFKMVQNLYNYSN